MPRFIRTALMAALAAACLAPTAAPSAEAAASAAPSASDFIRPAEFSDVQLAPDGKHIAALVPRPDTPYENMLAVIDTTTAKPVATVRSGSRTMLGHYVWANEHRLVVALAVRTGSLEKPSSTGELIAFDADGSRGTYLFGWRGGTYADSNHMLRGGQAREAYASLIDSALVQEGRYALVRTEPFTDDPAGSVPSIERLDVVNGNSKRIIGGPAADTDIIVDHLGEPRAALGGTYHQPKLWLRDAGKDWTLFNDPAKTHVSIEPVSFARDNRRLYVRVTHDEGPRSLELLDPQTGQRSMVYRGKFSDPGAVLVTADRQDIYGVITNEGMPGVHYIDPDGREAQISEALGKSFPGQLVRLTSFSGDGSLAIVMVSSDRDPGDYYLFDLDKRQARYLFSARRWLPPKQMHAMTPIELVARDGLPLHGFLTEPSGKGPFPMVVLPHGGPHGVVDRGEFDEESQLLASRGYAVLQVNYRGSGGLGSSFEERGYRQWGAAMQDDLTDATQWAIREGHADAKRICIYGGSYGGYAALEGAVREPELYRCAVGYAGVYDLRIQLDKSDIHRSDSGADYLKIVLGDDRAELLRRSPVAGVDRIKANLLLIHGGLDERAPFAHFRAFTAALDKQGKHYESLTEPQEGHGFFLQEHRLAMYDKLLDFLDRNIGPGSNGAAASAAP
ncbi:alpha/beta hydrolase family protein [Dyella japonica]|uniref:alpha/beta hydrolase family protein n=1 Tax=Dyella japonica TaxID=231455 RepID=UPI00069B6217|nr:S9 family peptidase [Dyella japonica]